MYSSKNYNNIYNSLLKTIIKVLMLMFFVNSCIGKENSNNTESIEKEAVKITESKYSSKETKKIMNDLLSNRKVDYNFSVYVEHISRKASENDKKIIGKSIVEKLKEYENNLDDYPNNIVILFKTIGFVDYKQAEHMLIKLLENEHTSRDNKMYIIHALTVINRGRKILRKYVLHKDIGIASEAATACYNLLDRPCIKNINILIKRMESNDNHKGSIEILKRAIKFIEERAPK
jgi:hypothetical protein